MSEDILTVATVRSACTKWVIMTPYKMKMENILLGGLGNADARRRRRPKQMERNFMFKFSLPCHEIWILFHHLKCPVISGHNLEAKEEMLSNCAWRWQIWEWCPAPATRPLIASLWLPSPRSFLRGSFWFHGKFHKPMPGFKFSEPRQITVSSTGKISSRGLL